MRWPLVSRARLDAAEAWVRIAESATAKAEAARELAEARDAALIAAANARADTAEQERRILTDRIAQLSGQPPIYERAVATAAAPPESSAPAPKRQISFDDVHEAARTAIANGTFSLNGRRPN
jgi:hypothetical protein